MKEWRWFRDLLFAPTAHVLFTTYLHLCLKHYTRHVLDPSLRRMWINVMHITCILERIFHVVVGHTCQPFHCTTKKNPNTIFTVCYKTFKNYEDSKGHLASWLILHSAIRQVMVALLRQYELWTQTSLLNVLWICKTVILPLVNAIQANTINNSILGIILIIQASYTKLHKLLSTIRQATKSPYTQ